MRTILNEFSETMGYAIVGIIFGFCFFLFFLNFYHMKEISTKIKRGDETKSQVQEGRDKLKTIETNIDVFDPNNYKGTDDKYSLMSIKSRIQVCLNQYNSKNLNNYLDMKEMTINDIYKFQKTYEVDIINNCFSSNITEIGKETGSISNVKDLSNIAPFVNVSVLQLQNDLTYINDSLENNTNYFFSNNNSKENVFEMSRDSYAAIFKSYNSSIDLLLALSQWFKNTAGGV